MADTRHIRLSALAGELLNREYKELADPGAFGRLAQEVVVGAIKKIHPEAHDNRGAGTPDCKYQTDSVAWSWEIKHDPDGAMVLSDRDIEGLMADKNAPDHRPRLLIIDMRFPVSVWCLDAKDIKEGAFNIDANAHLQQYEEASALAIEINQLLRRCDSDIIGSEESAKQLVRDVAGS